jgi:uncharacterized protein involved in exopolysaccharide biosynthesis
MATLDERVSHIDGVIDQMNERLGNLEQGLRDLHTELTEEQRSMRAEFTEEQRSMRTEIAEGYRSLRTELSEGLGSMDNRITDTERSLRAEMRSNFRWTLGITIAMWVTIMGAIVGTLLAS